MKVKEAMAVYTRAVTKARKILYKAQADGGDIYKKVMAPSLKAYIRKQARAKKILEKALAQIEEEENEAKRDDSHKDEEPEIPVAMVTLSCGCTGDFECPVATILCEEVMNQYRLSKSSVTEASTMENYLAAVRAYQQHKGIGQPE